MRVTLPLRPVALAIFMALAIPLHANAEEQKGRGAIDPRDPVLAPRPALTPAARMSRPSGPMKLHTMPGGTLGRTESFTDQGLGLPPAPPTERELAKLEAARIAVAAARAQAGFAPRLAPTVDPATPLHSVPASKLEQMRQAKPGAVPSDPALSGLPTLLRSRQLSGPAAPSARELEKLKATPAQPITPEVPKESER